MDKRDIALKLLKAGDATQSEVARLVKVSRQRVHQWCVEESINPQKLRWQRVKTIFNNPPKSHRRLLDELLNADWPTQFDTREVH